MLPQRTSEVNVLKGFLHCGIRSGVAVKNFDPYYAQNTAAKECILEDASFAKTLESTNHSFLPKLWTIPVLAKILNFSGP